MIISIISSSLPQGRTGSRLAAGLAEAGFMAAETLRPLDGYIPKIDLWYAVIDTRLAPQFMVYYISSENLLVTSSAKDLASHYGETTPDLRHDPIMPLNREAFARQIVLYSCAEVELRQLKVNNRELRSRLRAHLDEVGIPAFSLEPRRNLNFAGEVIANNATPDQRPL